jgi:hypothetical protein
LPQYEPVEQYLREAKIFRNIEWVEIVKGYDGGTVVGASIQWGGIAEMHDIYIELRRHPGKFCVVPRVPAHRAVVDACCMEMQTSIIACHGFANKVLLPRCRDQMNCRDLIPREQATGEIDSVPLHA